MIHILIADDHPFVRRGVKQVLTDEFPGVVVGEASTAPELLDLAGKRHWDLFVLDLTMPGRSGLDALHELKACCPDTPVLVLSMHPEDQFAVRVLRAGAAGYLTKESITEGSSVADLLATQLQQGDANQPPHARLSDREFQVLGLIAQGKTVTHIAEELSLSVKSVSTYRARILEKLHINSTAELTRYALEHRLIV